MFFSVIVPVYNTNVQYLSKCIESIICQGDIAEAFVVDDGSTKPETISYLEMIAKEKNIKVIFNGKNGVSAARNCGIKNASGEYFLFLDSDDAIRDGALKDIMEIVKNVKVDIMFMKHFSSQNLKSIPDIFDESKFIKNISKEDALKEVIFPMNKFPGYVLGTPWAKIIKRSLVIDKNLKYEENLPRTQDRVFMFDCIFNSETICLYDYISYLYNVNSESVCSKYNVDLDKKLILVYEAIKERIENYNTLELIDVLESVKWNFYYEVLKGDVFHKNNKCKTLHKFKRMRAIFKQYNLSYDKKVINELSRKRRIMSKMQCMGLHNLVGLIFCVFNR